MRVIPIFAAFLLTALVVGGHVGPKKSPQVTWDPLAPLIDMQGCPEEWGCHRALGPHFRVRMRFAHPWIPDAIVECGGNAFATTLGILTAHHVVEEKGEIVLIDERGGEWPVIDVAHLYDADGPTDSCILTTKDMPPCTLMQVHIGDVPVGSKVRMVGYFGRSGFEEGVLRSVDGLVIERERPDFWDAFGGTPIAVDFVANKGLSGSVLLMDDMVVGILSGGTAADGTYFTKIPQ